MTHNETRISNERLAARIQNLRDDLAKNIGEHKRKMREEALSLLLELQALRAPVEAEPISWLSFNDGSEPYLTCNQAEMIKLEATGPGPHALYTRSLPNPSPSDGEVSEAGYARGQWAALNDVLGLLNTFENKVIPKKDIYSAVSELRPKPDLFINAIQEALVAMKLATAIPGVANEFDFSSAISSLTATLQSSKGGQP